MVSQKAPTLDALRRIFQDTNLKPSAKLVAAALAARLGARTLTCHPSIGRLARDTGLSKATVKRALHQLLNAQEPLFEADGKRGRSNRYKMTPEVAHHEPPVTNPTPEKGLTMSHHVSKNADPADPQTRKGLTMSPGRAHHEPPSAQEPSQTRGNSEKLCLKATATDPRALNYQSALTALRNTRTRRPLAGPSRADRTEDGSEGGRAEIARPGGAQKAGLLGDV